MADSIADSIANRPVAMAYLLAYWVTDCWVTFIARRREDCPLISSKFDISLPTDCPVTGVTQQSVPRGESNLLGRPLYIKPVSQATARRRRGLVGMALVKTLSGKMTLSDKTRFFAT